MDGGLITLGRIPIYSLISLRSESAREGLCVVWFGYCPHRWRGWSCFGSGPLWAGEAGLQGAGIGHSVAAVEKSRVIFRTFEPIDPVMAADTL